MDWDSVNGDSENTGLNIIVVDNAEFVSQILLFFVCTFGSKARDLDNGAVFVLHNVGDLRGNGFWVFLLKCWDIDFRVPVFAGSIARTIDGVVVSKIDGGVFEPHSVNGKPISLRRSGIESLQFKRPAELFIGHSKCVVPDDDVFVVPNDTDVAFAAISHF